MKKNIYNEKSKPNAIIDNKAGEKWYKEVEKGLPKIKQKEENNVIPETANTTLHTNYDEEPSKEYKDRVKTQVKGYTSKMEETNGSDKNGDFEGNEKIYNSIKNNVKIRNKHIETEKESGLTAHRYPKSSFKQNPVTEKVQRLTFNKSIFLNETHMLSKVPESYKVNGNLFIMKDQHSNEYLVEWVVDKKLSISEGIIKQYVNEVKFSSDLNRIQELFKLGENYNIKVKKKKKK